MSILVNISGDAYSFVEEKSTSKRSYAQKTQTAYRKGGANSSRDPHRTERMALLGELAAAHVLGVPMSDTGYRAKGDGGKDFLIQGPKRLHKVDVKLTCTNDLIICVHNGSFPLEVKSDIFIAIKLRNDNTFRRTALLEIIGYITAPMLRNYEIVDSRKLRGVKNKEIPHDELKPIELLLEKMKEYDHDFQIPGREITLSKTPIAAP